MFNVCPGCCQYSVEKTIDPDGPFAVCPYCGFRQPFRRLPLFVLTGPSGAGKTTMALQLPYRLEECVTLETDILWEERYNRPEENYRIYRELWLRMAKNISQSGRPVMLVGTATPDQFESCTERRYFGPIHCLGLVCAEAELERRLRARPDWRDSRGQAFIRRMLAFNLWLKTEGRSGKPPIELLDTTHASPEETAVRVTDWVRGHLASPQ